MTDQGRRRRNGDVRVTRYTYDVKEPGTPETGHTRLLPGEEQIVSVPMDNGWTSALNVGKLEDGQEYPVVVDMDPVVDPVLLWAGKRSQRTIPVLPLQRNEVVSESRIAQVAARARSSAESLSPSQMSLFADLEREMREAEKGKRIEFYTHEEGWKNKLICGDSLLVMESLLKYEGLSGKVQVIYIDPPYGIRYSSNFQQRIDSTNNDEKDRSDDVVSIKAFRDTWSLGVHSYLGVLQERLYLCRDLLSNTGSIFFQIGDDNVHLVRTVLDEVFGSQSFVAQIMFTKTSSQTSEHLPSTMDYILWYAKDKRQVEYHQLYREKELGGAGGGQYTWLELPDGSRRRMSRDEVEGIDPLPEGSRVFSAGDMSSTRPGRAHEIWPVLLDGKEYWPTGSSTWKTNKEGIENLKRADRLMPIGNTLRYVRYLDDFSAFPLSNVWMDTSISGFGGGKFYAVQTSPKVISRCISMASSPGDLVLDITSGGGTTAYCAEMLGRRWITCDTSRVAINISRLRLLASVFPHYVLTGGSVSSGLRYRTLPRATMSSIAFGREPEQVELVDQPIIDKNAVRVCGPFEVMTIGRYSVDDWKGYVRRGGELENYIEVICKLYREDAAVQGTAGLIHAVAESESERLAISVGPVSGRVTARQLMDAVDDAVSLGITEVHILGWAFEANVGEVKSRLETRGRVKVELVMIRPDTLADGLKATKTDELFSPFAVPDLEMRTVRVDTGDRVVIELKGVGVFDRKRRTTDYYRANSGYVSAWYLDEDYDGDCFVDCQMFFDFAKAPNLQAVLKAPIDPKEYKLSLASEPFKPGQYRRVAVKVVDVYGNESTVVKDLP